MGRLRPEYIFEICLSCGDDLNELNWHTSARTKRFLRCKICSNADLPKNEELANFIQELSKPVNYNCRKCESLLTLNENWLKCNKDNGIYLCNICRAEKIKTYQQNTKCNILNRLDDKNLIHNGYENKCNCCGESGWQFLTIDHILNDGAQERKILNTYHLKKQLIDKNFPKDRYQLLCMNCNYSKGHNKFCPHEIKNKGNNCCFCKCDLNNLNMFKAHVDNNYSICKTCSVSINKKSNNTKPITNKTFIKKKESLTMKEKVIKNYGSKCECCNENEFYFLTIDHILGGGSSRINITETTARGSEFYRYLIKNNYPKDEFRLLCYNCNCSRGAWGKCYHELNREHNKIITIEDYKQLIMNNLV